MMAEHPQMAAPSVSDTNARAEEKKLEMLGALISGITHEINTPMHYLENNLTFMKSSFNDLIRLNNIYKKLLETVRTGVMPSAHDWQELGEIESESEPEYLQAELADALKQSLEGIDMVSRLVLALKDFSHPSLHEFTLIDVNKCIDTVCTISRHEWKRLADLQFDLAGDLPYIYGSRDELHQVLLNLVVNSAHAIGEKIAAGTYRRGNIKISTRAVGDRIAIEVADDGPGIPPENLAKIFEANFTTKPAGEGTGLGLSLVRKIVEEAHGGQISVASKPQFGVTFSILLPHRRNEKDL